MIIDHSHFAFFLALDELAGELGGTDTYQEHPEDGALYARLNVGDAIWRWRITGDGISPCPQLLQPSLDAEADDSCIHRLLADKAMAMEVLLDLPGAQFDPVAAVLYTPQQDIPWSSVEVALAGRSRLARFILACERLRLARHKVLDYLEVRAKRIS